MHREQTCAGFGVAAFGLIIETNSFGTEESVNSSSASRSQTGHTSTKAFNAVSGASINSSIIGTHASGVPCLSLQEARRRRAYPGSFVRARNSCPKSAASESNRQAL